VSAEVATSRRSTAPPVVAVGLSMVDVLADRLDFSFAPNVR
jgi:hypothetical protein